MSCEHEFLEQLRARGFRLTPQREMVLRVMHGLEGHVTAEEVYAQVSALSPAVDLSTVYRTLELLQEFNLVAVLDLGDGQRRYELQHHGHHHHLRCRACGELVTIDQEVVQPLIDGLRRQCGFSAELEHLIIPGLCLHCQEARP